MSPTTPSPRASVLDDQDRATVAGLAAALLPLTSAQKVALRPLLAGATR